MRTVSLASGSKGNAYCVGAAGEWLLIDCGLSFCELARRAELAGVELDRVLALLVTHEHTDHVSGVSAFHHQFPEVPIFTNFGTAAAMSARVNLAEADYCCFENSQEFEVGSFVVRPFPISHDTADPVGFLVRQGTDTYFHGTDCGRPLESVGRLLAAATLATLESNHDPELLRRSGRPLQLINRIAGPSGHLSNFEAGELVRRFATPQLRHLALAHLSHDCNAPHLAEEEMRAVLAERELKGVALSVLSQDAPSGAFGDGI